MVQQGAARVDVQGWGWRHAGRSAWAVNGVDFSISAGERVLLLGASGAGKSTLLHGLAGVLGGEEEGEHSGAMLIDRMPAAAARGRSGLVLQDPDSQVILSRVGDDVAFGCENLGLAREEIWRRVRESLDAVGLDVSLERSTSALSGGQKQRLALAGALAMRPGLLLLDEPTANLDPAGVIEVQQAVGRVLENRSTTLVVVEHRVEVWLPLVDRVIVLGADGGVLADGEPERVLREQGESLAAAGVWVPGHAPAAPERRRTVEAAPLLDARSLAVSRMPRHPVADGIELGVQAGRTLAVTGPNGAGKSTLALVLGGLLAPSGGQLTAFGDPRPPHRWKATTLTGRIGSVFQNPEHQFVTTRVADELAVGPRRLGRGDAEIRETVDALLDRLRLTKLAQANPYTLSGGEARRLSVATALATAPRLLVLDEPTFGQDRRTWIELVTLLATLRDEGHAVVAVTHDDDFVQTLADRTFALGSARLRDPLPRRRRS
jgi:energy-coupling factor transport system ATP-binding protein